jgi:hypothetical protein
MKIFNMVKSLFVLPKQFTSKFVRANAGLMFYRTAQYLNILLDARPPAPLASSSDEICPVSEKVTQPLFSSKDCPDEFTNLECRADTLLSFHPSKNFDSHYL